MSAANEEADAALPAPATEVTKEELRQWMDKQWCKPTPLCDLLFSTYTLTKREKPL